VLHGGPVHRQPVALELEAQHGRSGLGVGGGEGPRAELGERPLLQCGDLEQCGGQGAEPRFGLRPRRLEGVRAQVAVGSDGVVRVALVGARVRIAVKEGEEVVARRLGRARGVEAVQGRPHRPEVRPPAAVEDPVDLRDVPAPLDLDAGQDQRDEPRPRGRHQPAGVLALLERRGVADHGGDVADDHRVARHGGPDGGPVADDDQGEHGTHPTGCRRRGGGATNHGTAYRRLAGNGRGERRVVR
jgi:hypothetical protein